jgi:hypothetical protein
MGADTITAYWGNTHTVDAGTLVKRHSAAVSGSIVPSSILRCRRENDGGSYENQASRLPRDEPADDVAVGFEVDGGVDADPRASWVSSTPGPANSTRWVAIVVASTVGSSHVAMAPRDRRAGRGEGEVRELWQSVSPWNREGSNVAGSSQRSLSR